MICPKCGRTVRDAAAQCPHCGYTLRRRSSSSPTRRRKRKKSSSPVGLLIAALVLIVLVVAVVLLVTRPGSGDNRPTQTITAASTAATTAAPTTTTTIKQPDDPSVQPPAFDKTAPTEQLSTVLVMGDSAFEYYNYVDSVAKSYEASVNAVATALSGSATVYDIVVPTSMDICVPESVRDNIGVSDQKEAIDTIYSGMSDAVKTVPVFDALYQSNAQNDYCYFRTDHHWTALGAYRAYEQFAKVKGMTATPLSAFIEHKFPGYLGYFYYCTDNRESLGANPDVVFAYEPQATNTITVTDANGSTYDTDIIMDKSDSDYDTKYLTFIGGDMALGVINNPSVTDGSACVLVKESFGNAFAPFLVGNYQTVYVVDYRYFGGVNSSKLADFVREKGATDVIFLNNTSATRNEDLMDSLAALCQ